MFREPKKFSEDETETPLCCECEKKREERVIMKLYWECPVCLEEAREEHKKFEKEKNEFEKDRNNILEEIKSLKQEVSDLKERSRQRGYQRQEQQDILSGVERRHCLSCNKDIVFPTILLDLFDDFMSYRPNPYGELGKIPYKNFLIYCRDCLIQKYPIYQKEYSHVNGFLSPAGVVFYYIDDPRCGGYEQLESFCAFKGILTSDFKKFIKEKSTL